MRIKITALVLSVALLRGTLAAQAENWPAWRGPTGQGVSSETGLPVAWSATDNVRWKVALPEAGNSTPVIWGDRIFITQARETTEWPPKVPEDFAGGSSAGGYAVSKKRSLMCLQRGDGKLLWQADVNFSEPEITHPTNPFCSASPVTDGQRVIASHGSAGLVCYDLEGRQLWSYDVGKLEHLWGTASSPILHGNLCIVWCGPGERQFLLALDKQTGKKVWQTDEPGGDAGITSRKFLGSWATPLVAKVGDTPQLIFAVPRTLKGYDVGTGEMLWSAGRMSGSYCYTSPLCVEDRAIYGKSVLSLGGSGDLSANRLRYEVGSMYISTAVIFGDYLYTYSNVGVPACYEWKTGNELWKSQIEKRPGGREAWGSPVYADGRIYITDKRGNTSVFAAGSKYERLAFNELNEPTNASIAISGGALFIRTHKHLWCIGKSDSPRPAE